jgi:hypothetical protein
MSTDKNVSAKATATESAKTTTEQGKVSVPAKTTEQAKGQEPVTMQIDINTTNAIGKVDSGAIKTASTAMESKSATVKQGSDSIDNKVGTAETDKKAKAGTGSASTKMYIATEIYKRMWKVKDVTRKEIIEQFVAEAKLSKAGASTYFQLIKAAVK